MQLKTSTKISLKFTLFVTIILFIFSFIIVILFFGIRYSKQQGRLHINIDYEPPVLLRIIRAAPWWGRNTMVLPESTEFINRRNPRLFGLQTAPIFQEEFLDYFTEQNGYQPFRFFSFLSHGYINIFYKEESYFIYIIEQDKVRFLDITGFIYAQMELIQLLLLWDICFIVMVYLISLYFVKSSLKNLKKLTRYAQELDFEKLVTPLKLKAHKFDEIKVIADAFNASLEKIHTQIQALKDFTANASHELKTPLMMISTEIDIAVKKKDYEEGLLNIKEHVKRLSELLETLSLITRLESGTVCTKEKIALSPLLQEVVASLEKKYPEKPIEVDIQQEILLQAHPWLVEIVLHNLIENACKYAGEQGKISVIATDTSLSVIDTGKGIALAFQEKIFERFRQLEKTEKDGHSFWLGLYLVKKIIELHGWKITVESEVGKGSTFTITW